MQKKIAKIITVFATLSLITACSGSTRDKLGMRRSAPNEFKVVSNPPLSVPPEFSLRPPVAEDQYVAPAQISADAKNILFEKAAADIKVPASQKYGTNETNSEETFSSLFGADKADPNIKSVLQKEFLEAAKQEEKKSVLEKLSAFSGMKGSDKDPVVDAKLEKDRIIDSKKKGDSITGEGTATIESENKKTGFFNKVFGL